MTRFALILCLAIGLLLNDAEAQDGDGWSSVFFETQDEAIYLRSVSSVYISVGDNVVDGCWTGMQAAKNSAEIGLRRAGIEVTDDIVSSSHFLSITANGRAIDDTRAQVGCAGLIQFVFGDYHLSSKIMVGGNGLIVFEAFRAGFTMIDPFSLNDYIREAVVNKVDAIALRILRGRDSQ